MADFTIFLEESGSAALSYNYTGYEGSTYTVEITTWDGSNWELYNNTNTIAYPTSGPSGSVCTFTITFAILSLLWNVSFQSPTSRRLIMRGVFNRLGVPSDYGLEIYNSNNKLIVDPTSDLVRFAYNGSFTNVQAGEIVTVPIPGMAPDGTWAVIVGYLALVEYERADINEGSFEVKFINTIPSGQSMPWWVIRT